VNFLKHPTLLRLKNALAKMHAGNVTIAQMEQTTKLQKISVDLAKMRILNLQCRAWHRTVKFIRSLHLMILSWERSVYDDAKNIRKCMWNDFFEDFRQCRN